MHLYKGEGSRSVFMHAACPSCVLPVTVENLQNCFTSWQSITASRFPAPPSHTHKPRKCFLELSELCSCSLLSPGTNTWSQNQPHWKPECSPP